MRYQAAFETINRARLATQKEVKRRRFSLKIVDQLRVKQDRIQELDSQLARVPIRRDMR